ncbi:16 kDa phloem protein 1 [Rhodamnia argentea]|uniref:16 kDa phloem protein 1 n=1 Tax=Rhodamnia argentea TaxID=178133 RepID=A0ABM3HXU9_9MYRT|nr:16 kDa phloem protein 1 [Rhodamnia argentea]
MANAQELSSTEYCRDMILMTEGILEVLLVNAEGIQHPHLIWKPTYYLIAECGAHVHRTKISSGKDDKAWWNEKFAFELQPSDFRNSTHLKIRIKKSGFFSQGTFAGETIIYLGGIFSEGLDRGSLEVEPAPYNVVLEDNTYRGQITLGLKFIANVCTNLK